MKETTQNILAVIAIVLTILSLLFGDNILAQLKKPSLEYTVKSITINDTDFYRELNKLGKKVTLPTEILEVTITNKGEKAATNINICLQYTGNAFEVLPTSLENNQVKKKGKSETQISMSRLANNSDLQIKMLFEDKSSNLIVKYTDDFGSRIAKVSNKAIISIIQLISIIILILIVIVLIFLRLVIPKKKSISDLTNKISIIEKEKQNLMDENDGLKERIEEYEANEGDIDPKVIASLLKLVGKKKKA